MKPEEESYYIGFQDSQIVRKSILEAAKATVHTAHAHSRVRDIQDEKLKLRTELALVVKQIKDDLVKMGNIMPKRDVTVDAPTPIKRRVIADHRLDKIESALNEIEMRMKSL